jgi:6-phosphogluconolactonase
MNTSLVYLSCAESRELRVLSLDEASGSLTPVQTLPVPGRPMPLVLSPGGRMLHAALRSEPFGVANCTVDAHGRLALVSVTPLPASMAHLALDRTGRWLFAASYGDDRVCVSEIDAGGPAKPAHQVVPTGRHAHASVCGPGNDELYVTNLGSDQVLRLAFDASTGRLSGTGEAPFSAGRHGGPRHLALHPGGQVVYLLNELDGQLDVLQRDTAGRLRLLQTVSALPPDFEGKPWAAEVRLAPSARWLVASDRGSNTLSSYTLQDDGRVTLRHACVPTAVQPRAFAISPSGAWIVSAGEASGTLVVHASDASSGALSAPVHEMPVGSGPSWVEIVPTRHT